MGWSNRSLRWFGFPLLAFLSSVGCSQLDGDTASLTAPSLGPSALQSDIATTMARPSISYDATGTWHEVVTILRGNVQGEAVNVEITHTNGTLTHCGECEGELWTFTPLAVTPNSVIYSVTVTADDVPPCAHISGQARLNIATETITGTVSGKNEECEPFAASVVLTRGDN